MSENTISERLREFSQSEGLNNRQFEIRCGLYNGYVKDVGKGSRVGIDNLASIVEQFPHLSLNWLLLGQGPMHLVDERGDQNSEKKLLALCQSLICLKDKKESVMGELAETIRELSQKTK